MNPSDTKNPPGPIGDIDLGVMAQDQLGFLQKMVQEYGDITRHTVDGKPVTIVNDPDLVWEVLVSRREHYVKSGTPDEFMLVPLLGRGLLTTDGQEWGTQRALANPSFQHQNVVPFDDLMVAETDKTIDRWVAQMAPQRLDRDLTALTLTIVARSVLGSEVAIGDRFGEAVDDANRFMSHYNQANNANPSDKQSFINARSFIDQIVNLLIEVTKFDPTGREDLLARLVTARSPERPDGFSAEELRDQVVTILMAGHETTAKGLTWTLWLLCQHPEILDDARQEVDRVLQGAPPDASNLENLPLIRAIFNESLRLSPPVWIISRNATKADTLGGYDIPADSLVCISPWLLHRHPQHWTNPEEFNPQRFLTQEEPHPCAFLPFSAGPRKCIGQHFALLESVLVLARVLQRVDIALDPGHLVEAEALVTLRPRHGVLANLSPRSTP